ncbi:MAG TPA: hypothetical protein VM008_10940 [Phycisphaerae bacterium]|nr:hypothetical protein [Phycisphaerae bacterium]
MPRSVLLPLLLAAALLSGMTAAQTTAQQSDNHAATAPGVLYQDDSANSSATITQVLPNSSTSMMTLGDVRRIRVQQEILVIEWGTTATTLLPRQYISSVTINKRATPSH